MPPGHLSDAQQRKQSKPALIRHTALQRMLRRRPVSLFFFLVMPKTQLTILSLASLCRSRQRKKQRRDIE